MKLEWPGEASSPIVQESVWHHAASNICLDFHGDPGRSELCVFSDGNHHMALEQTLRAFHEKEKLTDIFYSTTPPGVYLDWLRTGTICIGNLRLSLRPDVIIGPDSVMETLLKQNEVGEIREFAASRGNSLLVASGNPKGIHSLSDVFRQGVRLFLSNPVTEKASHLVYKATLEGFAYHLDLPENAVTDLFNTPGKLTFGEVIHHREAPQAIVDSQADVALVYAHLALRYTRIFPEQFERIDLASGKYNVATRYAVGLRNHKSPVARALFQYFCSAEAAEIYRSHGLDSLIH